MRHCLSVFTILLVLTVLSGCPNQPVPVQEIPLDLEQRLALGHNIRVVSFSDDDSVIHMAAMDGLVSSFDGTTGAMSAMSAVGRLLPDRFSNSEGPVQMVPSRAGVRFLTPNYEADEVTVASYEIRQFPSGTVTATYPAQEGRYAAAATFEDSDLLLLLAPVSGNSGAGHAPAQIVSLATNTTLVSLGNDDITALENGAFSPDGSRAVLIVRKSTPSDAIEAQFWDLSTGEQIRTLALNASEGRVTVAAISPDNARVYLVATKDTSTTGGKDIATATVREYLWDTTSDSTPSAFRQQSGEATAIENALFSPDSSLLARAGGDEESAVALLNGADGTALNRLEAVPGGASALAFSQDGTRLAVADDAGRARVWNTETGAFLFTLLDGATRSNTDAVLSNNGGEVLVTGYGGVSSWNLFPVSLRFVSDKGAFVTQSPDGAQLLLSTEEGATILDSETGETVFEIPQRLEDAHYSNDETQIVRRYRQQAEYVVVAVDAQTGAAIPDAEIDAPAIVLVPEGTVSPGQRFTAVIDPDLDIVAIWDNASGTTLHQLNPGAGRVEALAFSQDGNFLATGTATGSVRIWNVTSGETLFMLDGHTAAITGLAFSTDGALLSSTGAQESMRLWDTNSGALVSTIASIGHDVWGLKFFPDGTRIAYYDGALRIADVESGDFLYVNPDAELVHDFLFLTDDSGFIARHSDSLSIWKF